MIKVLNYSDKLEKFNSFDEMFRARAAVFHDRLRWNVEVHDGWEIDHYDLEEDPIYLVSTDEVGHLTGSLRLLPTTGETMLRNEFATFFDEPVDVQSPTAWECTRFCVHPHSVGGSDSDRYISAELLMGLCTLALSSGIEQVVGLYDHTMTRVYRRIGWSPSPLAASRPEVGRLVVGIWDVSHSALETMTVHATSGTGTRRLDRQAA